MASWKKLDGYEFILWNFDRFDINSSSWVKQAFEAKKYAFAADYIRLYAIYNYGGIYLDMDIEVIKPFEVSMLNTDLMMGIESRYSNWMEAGCFGAEKGHPFIKKVLEYHNRPFENSLVLPHVMYTIWQENFADIPHQFYMPDVFTAKSFHTGLVKITPNTYTVHHFAGTWNSEADRKYSLQRWAYFKRFGDGFFSFWFYMLTVVYPKSFISNFLWIWKHFRKEGCTKTIKHYFKKYVLRRND
jgi:hypothetical protein